VFPVLLLLLDLARYEAFIFSEKKAALAGY
jgi:hypothetical protein